MRRGKRITLNVLLESSSQICRIADVKSIISGRAQDANVIHTRILSGLGTSAKLYVPMSFGWRLR